MMIARKEAEFFIRKALEEGDIKSKRLLEEMKKDWDQRFGLVLVG